MSEISEVLDILQYADRSPTNYEFRNKARRDYAFYSGRGRWAYDDGLSSVSCSGVGQWLDSDLNILRERRQTPLTTNMIGRQIKSLIGMEVSSRRRISFRPQYFNDENALLCEKLTSIGYFIQEYECLKRESSAVFKDMIVCGLGWLSVYDGRGALGDNSIKFERVHPLDIIPDFDDTSLDLSSMNYVFRKRWLPISYCQQKWQKFKKICDWKPYYSPGSNSPQLQDRDSDVTQIGESVRSTNFALIIELQRKIDKVCYRGYYDGTDRKFCVFSKSEAEDLSGGGGFDSDLTYQVFKTVFTGSTILEHGPCEPMVPGIEDFGFIPAVFETTDDAQNLPDGLVSKMISSQREVNSRSTKAVHLINSARTFISGRIDQETIDQMREGLRIDPSIMFIGVEGAKVDSSPNADLGSSQMQLHDVAMRSIEQQTGIHPEMMGEQTSAGQSGVAINRLQSASAKGQAGVFDSFSRFKNRVGRMMLNMLQNRYDLLVPPNKEDNDPFSFLLNQKISYDGEECVSNDIRGLPIGVYVDESGDYDSSAEEDRDLVDRLIQTNNLELFLSNPSLLRIMGGRNAEKLHNDYMSSQQQKQQMQTDAEIQIKAQGQQLSAEAQ